MNSHYPVTFLVLLLALPVAGCSKPASEAPSAASASVPGIASLLPANNAVPGWTQKTSKLYGPNDLWEYIDGGAESYLACGYQEVMTAEYVNTNAQAQVLIDVYRMTSARGAFGIYSQEADARAAFKPIGAEGYVHGTIASFWSGPYYVKLTTFTESEALRSALLELATAVAARIPAPPGHAPVETSWFPPDGLVPHTVRYLPARVLGQPYLSEGFEARYRDGEREHRLVLVTASAQDKPAALFERYRAYVAATQGGTRDVRAVGDAAFEAHGANGSIVAARKANRIVIAQGHFATDAVLLRMQTLLDNATRQP